MGVYVPPMYNASAIVTSMHDMPRWVGNSTFVYDDSSYYIGASIIPAIICGLVLLMLFIAVISCCCSSNGASLHGISFSLAALGLVASLILLGVGAGVGVYGGIELQNGINSLSDDLGELNNLFGTAISEGESINSLLSDVQTGLDAFAVACPALSADADTAKSEIVDSSSEIDTYLDLVSGWHDNLKNAQDYSEKYSTWPLWVILGFTVPLAVCALGLFTILVLDSRSVPSCGGSCLRNFLMWFLCSNALLVAVIFGIGFVASVVGGDVCIDPDPIILRQLSGDVETYTSYYQTCQGNNPFVDALSDSRSALEGAQAQVGVLKTVAGTPGICTNTIAAQNQINAVNATISKALIDVDDLELLISCGNINPIYTSTVYDARSLKKIFSGDM